jgi:hypothetical protein
MSSGVCWPRGGVQVCRGVPPHFRGGGLLSRGARRPVWGGGLVPRGVRRRFRGGRQTSRGAQRPAWGGGLVLRGVQRRFIEQQQRKVSFDLATAKPILSGTDKTGGMAVMHFIKGPTEGVNMYCQREGDADWVLIGRANHSPFIDNRPLLPGRQGRVAPLRGRLCNP